MPDINVGDIVVVSEKTFYHHFLKVGLVVGIHGTDLERECTVAFNTVESGHYELNFMEKALRKISQ